jgi:NAD dependent epimerase/dehydratase family enzyme
MTRILGRVLKRPTVLPPVPGFALRWMLGEFAESLLKGQRVVPAKLEASSFRFSFPEIQQAFENVLLD